MPRAPMEPIGHCGLCGDELAPRLTKFCCRAHRLEFERLAKLARTRVCAREGCGRSVDPKDRPGQGPQLYCSHKCRWDAQLGISRELHDARRWGIAYFSCLTCHRIYAAQLSRVTCLAEPGCRSRASRAVYLRNRDSIIAAAYLRHDRVKGQQLERVIPRLVYERDGWICQICKQPVRHEPRVNHDGLMASLDHKISIADGGAHSYANTQCAHLACNRDKGKNSNYIPVRVYI